VTRGDIGMAIWVAGVKTASKDDGIIHVAEMMVVRNVPVDNTTIKKNSKAVNSAILANIPTKKSSKVARTACLDFGKINQGRVPAKSVLLGRKQKEMVCKKQARSMVAKIVPQENIPIKTANTIVPIANPDSTRTNPVSPRVKNVLLG
jgi:hypothetical protein